MARGGKRPGAGRKKGYAAKNAEEARKFIAERVSKEMGPIVNALIKKAKQGDIRAAKELFDRAYGRPESEPKRPLFSYDLSLVKDRYNYSSD
jgi:hypothetical protein